jgi:hypothetical protein
MCRIGVQIRLPPEYDEEIYRGTRVINEDNYSHSRISGPWCTLCNFYQSHCHTELACLGLSRRIEMRPPEQSDSLPTGGKYDC